VKLNWKAGSVGELRIIEPPPPMGTNLGSTESAIAREDETPRKIRLRNHREKFMSNPSRAHTSLRTLL
jgi:hypothetical protein